MPFPHSELGFAPMKDRIYRFGTFELVAAEGELRTGNSAVRLQEKPLLLLTALLDNPQKLVTREQLRERMWDSQTFVDYEQGINVAIKKVRDALGDSAEHPTFIETVAKKGYRFLLPVDVTEPHPAVPSVSESPAISGQAPILPEAIHWSLGSWILAGLAGGILLTLGLWYVQVQAKKPPKPTQIHSLAVLPLRNLSPDPGQDYFADGVTEEVITDLAQSLPLRVISRTSAMRYRQTNEPITQIARELGVEAIVEGAVARFGNRVTVTVQLIDATEDRHLWARKYDRDAKDLLSVEAELSQEIASQVGGTLAGQRMVSAANARPVDPQVHELCLLGLYHWNKRTAADLTKAADYYQQAIDRDSKYAPAYAGLAASYALLPQYTSIGNQECYTKSAAAARRALELDDTLAEAHATAGFVELVGPNWKQSEHEFRRAIELNPSYATAHHWISFYFVFSNQIHMALAEMEAARQLDPLSAIINADEGHLLYVARRYEEAKARLRRAIELAPDLGQPHETLAFIELETGNASNALSEARTGLALDPSNPRTMGEAGYVLAVTGHNEEAKQLLAKLNEMIKHGSAFPAFAGLVDLGLGQRGDALAAVKQSLSFGSALKALNQWHAFDELHADPRYQKLLAETRQ